MTLLIIDEGDLIADIVTNIPASEATLISIIGTMGNSLVIVGIMDLRKQLVTIQPVDGGSNGDQVNLA